MATLIKGTQIRDQSIQRVDIELDYNDTGALRAEDIPFDNSFSIKTKLSEDFKTSSQIATDYVDSAELATSLTDYLTSGQIITNFKTSSQIATDYIDSAELATSLTDYLTSAEITTHFKTSSEIETDYIDSAELATSLTDYLTSSQIATDYATSADISNFITSAAIASTNLEELNDVTITSISSGQVLKWNGSNWVNSADTGGTGGSSTLSGLTDVVISDATLSTGQALVWNGSNWVNSTVSGGSGASALGDLTDVTISSGALSANQTLVYNGSYWENGFQATLKGFDLHREIFSGITSSTTSIDLTYAPYNVDTTTLVLGSEMMVYGASYDWTLSSNGTRVLLSSAITSILSSNDYIEAKYYTATADAAAMWTPRVDTFTSADITAGQISFSLTNQAMTKEAITVVVNDLVLHQDTHWTLSSDKQTILINNYTLSSTDEMQIKYTEGVENYAINEGAYIFFKQERVTAVGSGLISYEMSQYPASISSVQVWRNGIYEESNVDYSVVGKQIVFSGQVSATDDVVALYGKYQSLQNAQQERPSGAINGINTTYTLSGVPIATDAVVLFHNGVFQEQATDSSAWGGKDYIISGLQTIVMSSAPSTGVLASYYYTASPSLISTFEAGVFNQFYLRDTVSTDNIYKLIVSAGTLVVSRAN